jgi:hypothetical protein
LPSPTLFRSRQAGGDRWLLRRQGRPDARGPARQSVELVCRGVEGIALSGLDQPTSAPTTRRVAEGLPLPKAVVVKVTFVKDSDDRQQRTIERTVFLQ